LLTIPKGGTGGILRTNPIQR